MVGTSTARYEPFLELARGGMGTVHLAWKLEPETLDTLVVMKRVHPHLADQPEFLDMLRDEARITANIRHPNVARLLDFVEDGTDLTIVQEYVESCTLAVVLKALRRRGQRIPLAVLSRILCDALDGLHAAHCACDAAGRPLAIVHRDATPQNILVGSDGRSRVIDFGIAKAEDRLTSTRVGVLKGKAGYIAPEQVTGSRVDRRADVFAIGVILHEGLAGRRLFGGDSIAVALRRTLQQEITPPSVEAPALSKRIDEVALCALSLDPADRFDTAASFRHALAKALPPAGHHEVAAFLTGTLDVTFAHAPSPAGAPASEPQDPSPSEVTVVDSRRVSHSMIRMTSVVTQTKIWRLFVALLVALVPHTRRTA